MDEASVVGFIDIEIFLHFRRYRFVDHFVDQLARFLGIDRLVPISVQRCLFSPVARAALPCLLSSFARAVSASAFRCLFCSVCSLSVFCPTAPPASDRAWSPQLSPHAPLAPKTHLFLQRFNP